MGTTRGRAGKPRQTDIDTTDIDAPDTDADDTALDEARFGLWRTRRRLSAKHVVTFGQFIVATALVAGAVWLARENLALFWLILRAVAWVAFTGAIVLRLFAAGASLTLPEPPAKRWTDPLPVYTVLCPLRREAASVPGLAAALRNLDYPAERLDVKIIIEADDAETAEALENTALPAGYEIVHVPVASPRTKPKALNYALTQARGAFVTVYDAEDVPHPQQLRAALDAFASGGARLGAVQAPLLVDNGRSSWLAGQFAAEYAIQFCGIVPLLAHLGAPPPLGGTSNHFRREALEDTGAWDPFNVTEDADLGYRLARSGWRIGAIASPTWEEAPARLVPWIRQRARWIKGHLQTWLVLMRDPLRTIREMGLGAFLAMQVVLGGGLLAAMAHLPLLGALMFAVAAPGFSISAADWTLVISGYATATLAALFAAAVQRDRRLAIAALTMPFYWPLSSLAALPAVFDLFFRTHYWAKTDHGRTPRNTPHQWTLPPPSPSSSSQPRSSPSAPGAAPSPPIR
ncbi:MAG: glycosyltransferase [Hyphomonadaceae bacterium]|nr:glycosyltransferase [Hyphomonadaceae bacterium]